MKAAHTALTTDLLEAIGSIQELPRGDVQTSCVAGRYNCHALIEAGAILLYAKASNGERYNLSIQGCGHVFSASSINNLLARESIFGLEVMRPVRLRWFVPSEWSLLVSKHPCLPQFVIQQEAKLLHVVKFHLSQLHQRSSLDMARFAIATYAAALGSESPCGSRVITVSRSELASWIRVSADRMCRLISALKANGEIEVDGRTIKVGGSLLNQITYTPDTGCV